MNNTAKIPANGVKLNAEGEPPMPGALKRLVTWVADNVYLVALVEAVALLAITENPFFLGHPHWQIFLKELAFAVAIAAFFALTIERYQREEFIKLVNSEREELKRDIFLYAYGHGLPEEIRIQIRESILEVPFQRKNLRIDWEFSQAIGDANFVKLEKRYAYVLRNTTPQPQAHQFRYAHVSASEINLETTEFRHLKVTRKEGVQSYQQNNMKDERLGPHARSLTKEIQFAPGESVEIFYEIVQRRESSDEDNYAARQPLVGETEVTVRVNDPLLLEVSASCKAQPLEGRPDHDPPRRYCWRFDYGLLPFQGIAISWSPTRTRTTGAEKKD